MNTDPLSVLTIVASLVLAGVFGTLLYQVMRGSTGRRALPRPEAGSRSVTIVHHRRPYDWRNER